MFLVAFPGKVHGAGPAMGKTLSLPHLGSSLVRELQPWGRRRAEQLLRVRVGQGEDTQV